MARARNIKPGFFSNDQLAELPALTRLLFAGLWTIADRAGRLEDRPKKIKAEVLPYDNANVDKMLDELAKRNFLIRYEVKGIKYLQVTAFAKHQNPHKNEAESTIPAPEQHSTNTVQAPAKDGTNRADSLNLIPDSLSTDSGPSMAQFEEVWKRYPKRAGNNPKQDAFTAWKARILEGENPEILSAAVDRYAAFCEATEKTHTETVMQALRFFGPKKLYDQDWTPPKANGSAAPAWWASDEGIEAKGRELGMSANKGESYRDYRQRIQARLNQ